HVSAAPSATIMRRGEYAALGQPDKAKIDRRAMLDKQERFELALGRWLEKHILAKEGADILVKRVLAMIDEYVKSLQIARNDLRKQRYEQEVQATFGTRDQNLLY